MTVCEKDLRDTLTCGEDHEVESALHRHFEAVSQSEPLGYAWSLRADVEVRPAPPTLIEGAPPESLGKRLLRLANQAQRMLRLRRFERMREEYPHWPVVVAEGDSWVAHPLVSDIADHLLDDDRFPLAVLGVGAADDRLGAMEAARDHERAVAEHQARALIVSGGGNDLLVSFVDFLRLWHPGQGPLRLIDAPRVDDTMRRLMGSMRSLLTRARERMPEGPILVHGYDYLRVRARGQGSFLGPLFDQAAIDADDERQAVLRAIVDRYNDHLRWVAEAVPGVVYLDLRTQVPDGEWYDEIHPSDEGFSRLGVAFGECLSERLVG